MIAYLRNILGALMQSSALGVFTQRRRVLTTPLRFSTLTATFTQPSGHVFPPGALATFTTNLGTFANGLQIYITTTDSNGQATARLRSAVPGIATVTVTPEHGATGTTTVTFTDPTI